jgi:hypothetical protein
VKTRSKLALIGVSAIIPLSVFAGVGLADPSDLFVADVPPHRHFVQTPNGSLSATGPKVCENPDLQNAFEQYHHNVHHSLVPGYGTVHTNGPQDGAPGLHPSKQKGAVITARPC